MDSLLGQKMNPWAVAQWYRYWNGAMREICVGGDEPPGRDSHDDGYPLENVLNQKDIVSDKSYFGNALATACRIFDASTEIDCNAIIA